MTAVDSLRRKPGAGGTFENARSWQRACLSVQPESANDYHREKWAMVRLRTASLEARCSNRRTMSCAPSARSCARQGAYSVTSRRSTTRTGRRSDGQFASLGIERALPSAMVATDAANLSVLWADDRTALG